MSTPTEVHLDLALQIAEALARSGNVAAAKLIADSEARAVASAVASAKADLLALEQCHDDNCRGVVKIAADLASAKADLLALEQYHNTNCRSVVKFADDFVTERARLDWLMAGGVCLVQHSGRIHVSRLHAPVSRADIDAGMKEDAK